MDKSERKSKKKQKHKLEELRPMASYVGDRPALLSQLFSALPKDKMLAMLPPVLRDVPQDELRADCLEMLLGLSARRIRSVLRGEPLGSSSSSDTDSQSEASREPSPNRQPPASPAPVVANENCSLLEIVELQLRARAIRAALNHGEGDDTKEPPSPPKKVTPPPVVATEPTLASEGETEQALEPEVETKVTRAKKRPVLVGPLKRPGKRVLLTTNNGSSSTQPSAGNKSKESAGISLPEPADKAKSETCVSENEGDIKKEVLGEESSISEAIVLEATSMENRVDEKSEVQQSTTNPTDLDCSLVEPEQLTADKMTPDVQCTENQDATWVDRRLQQAASPTLRSSLIGTTRQRLVNNDAAADSTVAVANGSQSNSTAIANDTQVDANEGSVSQYDSLASNALDIEPLILNYEEDGETTRKWEQAASVFRF